MITVAEVRSSITAAMQGHLDLQVVPYLFQEAEHLKDRVLMFVDTIPGSKLDTSSSYEIDQQCGAQKTVAYLERGTLVCWLAIGFPDDSIDGADAEAIRGKVLAKLIQFVSADRSLGIDMPGVDYVRVSLGPIDTRTEPMSVAGGQPIPVARAAIELDIEARITPASLATS